GHGVIDLSNSPNNRIIPVTAGAVLNNVNNTIRGSGQLGVNQLVLTNTGTIQANQPNAPPVGLSNASTFTNQGTVHASNGATLAFTDSLTNASFVKVDASSTFSSGGAFTQSGGVTSINGGTLGATTLTFQVASALLGTGTINGATT